MYENPGLDQTLVRQLTRAFTKIVLGRPGAGLLVLCSQIFTAAQRQILFCRCG